MSRLYWGSRSESTLNCQVRSTFGPVPGAENYTSLKHLDDKGLGVVWSEAAGRVAQHTDSLLQHESCSGGAGTVSAGDGGGSVSRPSQPSRPSWHGLDQRLPPGLQLPVPPRRGDGGCQELLQRAGRLGPLVVLWMPAHTRGPGGAQRLLVGWHQPCWDRVVGVTSYLLFFVDPCAAVTLTTVHWQKKCVCVQIKH